mgnify:FL=1|jgi:hypothetical protein|tara:strand:- start:923 stop:1042 length:120 start_codon:yes stop_codon:yes gene_type:complete
MHKEKQYALFPEDLEIDYKSIGHDILQKLKEINEQQKKN